MRARRRLRRAVELAAAALLVAAACGEQRVARHPRVRRLALEQLAHYSLSGTARDGHGRLWAVAENERLLFRIDDPEDGSAVPVALTIHGVPAQTEIEALTWLEEGTFLLGGETNEPSAEGPIFLLRLEGDTAHVRAHWALPWSLFGLEPRPNQGIEALCSAGPHILVGVETALEKDSARWGLIAHTRRSASAPTRHEPFAVFRVRLTSSEGKLSSLDCFLDEEEIEILAIERHYEVARLLRFAIPLDSAGEDLVAESVVDLAPMVGDLPNMEGITATARGLYIITDHGEGGGRTENLIIGPSDDDD